MKTIKSKIKETVIILLAGAVLSIVPFYFETKAMTEDNQRLNIQQEVEINTLHSKTEQVKLDQALGQSETKHNKEILLRIEKKVDDLREELKEKD